MVSVVIPAYNYARYLHEAIGSALGQGSPDCPVEIVVLDDGSTDDTPAVAAAFGSAIRYQRQENAGLSAARNAGMRAASHDLVIFLDADDRLLPGAVGTLVEVWQKADPPFAVLASRNVEMDAEGRQLDSPPPPDTGGISRVSARDLVIRNRFATTVLADRRILLGLGGFDESLPASEDRDMWIRVAASHPVALLDRVTLAVRKHGANMSKAATRQSLAIDRVLAKAFADPALGLSSRDRRLARAVRHYQSALMRTNAGETGAALAEMATSLALVPFGGAGDDALPLVPRYRGLASLALKCLRQWRRNK
ncbi:MAG: glycosyltransferase family 2 protein [Verrucomicrobia bacterium]|nr:glycosyltransferase family 2 protein [Verrucomicrobiota bacterium]